MKKQIIAIILCTVLLILLLPFGAGATNDPLNFVAVDDLLPAELINSTLYYNGRVYIPSWLIQNYPLGITYFYISGSSVACLDSGKWQLYFNLKTGKTTDEEDYVYPVSAITANGTVYLPLSFISSYFETFSYSNVGENEYGNILRINTGNGVLTDRELLLVTKPAAKRLYDAYYAKQTPATPTPTPHATPTPTATPPATPSPDPTHENDTVYLGLVGLPKPELLERLEKMGMDACFFLRAEEIRGAPDLVRELACRGFGLGVCCEIGTAAEYREAAGLLWEATRVNSILAAIPEGAAEIEGAACFTYRETDAEEKKLLTEAYSVTAGLDALYSDAVLLFPVGGDHSAALSVLLYFLRDQQFRVTGLREIDKDRQ